MPTVSLFADSAFGRRPRFHFLRSSDDPNKLVDVIALPCAPQDLGIDTFQVFSTKAVVPDLDKDVTAFGYATNVPAWPEGSARGGQIICDDQAFLVANLDTPEGFSGGPVTSAAGSLIGVLVGQGRPGLEDSHDRIVVVGIVDILPQLKDGILPPHASVPFFPPPVN